MLALIILTVAALPAHVRGGGHGFHGHGHWVSQLYGDKYGNHTYVPEWVPGQWVCWY